jgi:Flp pilus assembly pilin Flp
MKTTTWNTELLASLDTPSDSKNRPGETDDAAVIERLLLLAFLVVATATVAWHLTTGLHWMWSNCAAHLHFAAEQASRPL